MREESPMGEKIRTLLKKEGLMRENIRLSVNRSAAALSSVGRQTGSSNKNGGSRERMKFGALVGVFLAAVSIMAIAPGVALAQQKKDVIITSYQSNPGTPFAFYTSIPIYMKYYEAEGLNVTFEGAPGGANAVQRMITGNADLIYLGTYPIVVSRAKDVPLKAFLHIVRSSVGYPAVLDDSPIRELKQFKGKVIGVNSMGTGVIPVIKAMLGDAGMDPDKDVKFVVSGVGAQAAAAIRTGQIDIMGLWDAGYWQIEALGDQKFRKISSPLLDSLAWSIGMFGFEDYMKNNPKVIAGVGRAVSKSVVFAKTNVEAAIKIHWKVYPQTKPTGIDEAVALKQHAEILRRRIETMDLDLGNMQAFGTTSEKDVRAMYNFLVKGKTLEKEFDPRILFTNEFIAQINDYDVKEIERAARDIKID